jgi:hypothetical protein
VKVIEGRRRTGSKKQANVSKGRGKKWCGDLEGALLILDFV